MATTDIDVRTNEFMLDYLDNANVGLHWVDGEATIMWANKADYEPLGYTKEEWVGHKITEFHASAETIDDILTRLARRQVAVPLQGRHAVQGRLDHERGDRLQRPVRRRRVPPHAVLHDQGPRNRVGIRSASAHLSRSSRLGAPSSFEARRLRRPRPARTKA
jgi:PAS domain-containing protein